MATSPLLHSSSPSSDETAGRLHTQHQQQHQSYPILHPRIVMTTTSPAKATSLTSSSLRHHHETSLDDEDEIPTSQHLSTTKTAATVTKTTATRREHQQQQTVYSDASTTYSRPDTLSFTISMSGKAPTTEKVKSKNDSPTSLDSALASSRGSNSSVRQHPSRSRVGGSKASFSSRRSSSQSDSSESDFEHLDMCPTVKPKRSPSSSSPPPVSSNNRPCNRYGWFIDSDEAQVEERPIPPEVIMRREAKWIEMTSSHRKWNKYVTKRFKTLRKRCRKGIPHSIRARAWFYLCGGHKTLDKQQGLFNQLDSLPGDENINQEISKDLHRQFPSHEIFAARDGSGQQDLFRILKAYSVLKPEVGYCQGQAPLAAVLLMIMPAEHAFISLSNLCDLYLQGYFDPGLETLQLHGDMLYSLMRRYHSSAHKLLKKQNIEPVLYMTEWFMCLFSRTLPWPVVLRVWDMFMCEGIIIIFKVAIVLVGSVIDGERKSCKSMYDTLQLLKHPPQKYLTEQFILSRVNRLDLTETDLKREHAIQSNNRRIKQIAEEKRKQNAIKEAEKARQASSSSRPSSRASPAKNGGSFHATSNNSSYTRSSRSPSKQNGSSSGVTSTSAVNRSLSGSVNQTHMAARKTISSPPNTQQQDNDSQRYICESSLKKSSSSHVSPSPSSHHSQRRSSPAPRDTFRVVREHQKERSPPKYVR